MSHEPPDWNQGMAELMGKFEADAKVREEQDRALREEGLRHMLLSLGEDPDREGLRDTPRRVVRAWGELTAGYKQDPKKLLTVFGGEDYNEMVMCGPISFFSTCEHHLLPFFGSAWLAYVPGTGNQIIGLSKLPRLVEIYSKRLQNQERMTKQIASTLFKILDAAGTACLVRGQHFCMMARGVKQADAQMTTCALEGVFFHQPQTRAEFLSLVSQSGKE